MSLSLSLKKNKQSGFTLIELMVVMAIIAILATAGLSAYTGYLRKARDSIRERDMQTIYRMLLEYNTIYGGIATVASYGGSDISGWDMSSRPIATPTFMSFLVTSGITEKVPMDSINNATGDPTHTFSGYTYFYHCYSTATPNNYSLWYIREKDNTKVWFKLNNSEFRCL